MDTRKELLALVEKILQLDRRVDVPLELVEEAVRLQPLLKGE